MIADQDVKPTVKKRGRPRGALGRPPQIRPEARYGYEKAAQLARVSESTIRRAMDAGYLKTERVGFRIVFLGADLLAWLQAGRRTGRTSAHIKAEIERVA